MSYINMDSTGATIAQATPELRFVKRGTLRILQQKFRVYCNTGPAPVAYEWRDVPLVDEEPPHE